MNIRPVILILVLWSLSLSQAAAQRGPAFVSNEVHPDKTVTFRFRAPDAKDVKLSTRIIAETQQMTKDENGVWSVTIGPAEPDFYPYNFIVDGVQVMDPNKPEWYPNEHNLKSMIQIPADSPQLYDIQDVPHGVVYYERYKTETGETRPLVIYTPPGYEENKNKKYPVFYLISGTTDTEETWYKAGKTNFILDNLIARGKAVPMIVVMPYGNNNVDLSGQSGSVTETMYQAFQDDLLNNIIPFVEDEYRTLTDREHRAIAGFSRGGGQTLWSGLRNPDLFAYVFSYSAYIADDVFEKDFKVVHGDVDLTNDRLKLFWLTVGYDDRLYDDVIEFIDLLNEKKINHETFFIPGGHTWMSTKKFLGESVPLLFK
ncbi:MAG TPA: alpha/beta hydrolase-fold protein [Draconibacterium sp.]|nr:alpha/beta hydrolase-fold protein [Draconibacterium sp.]